jgi:Contractile injection system tube protein
MAEAPHFARAYFKRLDGSNAAGASSQAQGNSPDGVPSGAVSVQFNPLTLQYGLTINNQQAGARPSTTQNTARAEASLEMDLVFDTTHDGTDVRGRTVEVRNLTMSADEVARAGQPAASGAPADQAAPKVEFVWGTFRFVGVLKGFRETLDFFSAEGVPVRSAVHVSMASTENSEVFQAVGGRQAALGSDLGQSLSQLGQQDAHAGRAAGAALGAASLRVGLHASVNVSGRGAGPGMGLKVGASVSVSKPGASSAETSNAALGQLAQLNAQRQAGAATPLGGSFGFGGAVQGNEPSGLRSRLGVLDFSSSGES